MEQAFLLLKGIDAKEIEEYRENMMHGGSPYHSLRLVPAEYGSPAKGRRLNTHANAEFLSQFNLGTQGLRLSNNEIINRLYGGVDRVDNSPLPILDPVTGQSLSGRFVFPAEAFSFSPNITERGYAPNADSGDFTIYEEALQRANPDVLPTAHQRNLNLYGFEGISPQRYGTNIQPEGIIYGDLDESQVHQLNEEPLRIYDISQASRLLNPLVDAKAELGDMRENTRKRIQRAAQALMLAGVPPILMDPKNLAANQIWGMDDPKLSEPMGHGNIQFMHDPYQQWDMGGGMNTEDMHRQMTHGAMSPEQFELLDHDLIFASEPMEIAMRLLKNRPYHEMSNDELEEIFFGETGYDVGEGRYTRDKTISSQKEKDLALQELLTRMRETEGNPVSVFDKNQEEKSRLVDFYEPQFAGQNISPDVFIPQNEKEGQEAYEFMEDGEMGEHIDERLSDIDEFMPGKTFFTDPDYADKYNHLRATAPPEVAENFLNRYRDFVMRNNENPEYVNQSLMQMFDENQEITAPQYTQEFPTDASIFDTEVPYKTMNTPDATGFQHNWQAKNASEPMDIAMRLLKMPQEAKDYANQIHEGQMYGEQPYMNHVEDVASGFDDPHLQRIAYLHDTIEDSETGIGEIHERFGEDVGHAVDALTRRQGEQYFDYINRVKEHPEATQVKLADLHSNLKNNPNESLARRYQKAIGILTNKSEPMDIAMRLLKERVSPEAKRHKLEYDKKYESSPERVKYREELNRERRRRHIMGQGGPDMSHTSQHTIVPEDPHTNRARHFKDKGTLL